jgi:hypothetical protein
MSTLEEVTGNEQNIIEEACGNEAVKEALNQLMNEEEAIRDFSGKSQGEIKDILKEIITRNKDSMIKAVLSEKPSLGEIAEMEGLSKEDAVNRILDFTANVASYKKTHNLPWVYFFYLLFY